MCRLVDGQTAEKPQLDDLTPPGVKSGQALERAIQCDQVDRAFGGHESRFVEADLLCAPAALRVATRARVIDEDSPHEARGNPQKVCAILPAEWWGIRESHKHFVDKGGGLECVAFSLAAHVAAGETPHFAFDERDEAFERGPVAVTPRAKEPGNLVGHHSVYICFTLVRHGGAVMKHWGLRVAIVALTLAIGVGAGVAAATKTYQFTGIVKSSDAGTLVVEKSAKETWTFATDKDTKGTAKVGDKVTVMYKMIATDIDVKPAATAPKKK